MKTLESWIDRDQWNQCPCPRTAWSILNDCYADPEFILENKPQFIAAAVIYVTLRIYGISVPHADSNDEKPWWTILSGVETSPLLKMAQKILDITQTESEKR